MPDPKDFKDKDSFIKACISKVLREGKKTKEQAAGQCFGMWKSHKSLEIIKEVKKGIQKYIDQVEIIEKYEIECPRIKDLTIKGEELLIRVYSNYRNDGGDKTKAFQIAKDAVEKAGYNSTGLNNTWKELQKQLEGLNKLMKPDKVKKAKKKKKGK